MLPAAAALVLAGCGGPAFLASSSKSPTTTAPAPTVTTARNPTLGTILVDSSGKTLYEFSGPCSGGCLGTWRPLTVASGTTAPVWGPGVTGMALVDQGQQRQVTYMGHVLYTYTGDSEPGEAKGNGVNAFGGRWGVATVAPATPPSTSPPATSAPATSGSGNGAPGGDPSVGSDDDHDGDVGPGSMSPRNVGPANMSPGSMGPGYRGGPAYGGNDGDGD